MGTVRNVLELLADTVHGHACPFECGWRPGFRAVFGARLTVGLVEHVREAHPDRLEVTERALQQHATTAAIAERRGIELGVAVLDPDSVGYAHRPDDLHPLEVTWCGLSRRRFGWTMPLAKVPTSRRCPTCFPPATTQETP